MTSREAPGAPSAAPGAAGGAEGGLFSEARQSGRATWGWHRAWDTKYRRWDRRWLWMLAASQASFMYLVTHANNRREHAEALSDMGDSAALFREEADALERQESELVAAMQDAASDARWRGSPLPALLTRVLADHYGPDAAPAIDRAARAPRWRRWLGL
ncbi:unnamed protein product [Pedinophyceae sp. YPF-701]|nr:unnamed protein product [Pedinophyceae sp. YPF-701]